MLIRDTAIYRQVLISLGQFSSSLRLSFSSSRSCLLVDVMALPRVLVLLLPILVIFQSKPSHLFEMLSSHLQIKGAGLVTRPTSLSWSPKASHRRKSLLPLFLTPNQHRVGGNSVPLSPFSEA